MSDADQNLYVSAVKGHLVTRFGTGLLIGATRDQADPSKVTWDEGEIAKIGPDEQAAYRREYARALRDGALKARTKAEYEGVVAKHDAAVKREADERAKGAADASKSGKKE
jgi:hypothetical protein